MQRDMDLIRLLLLKTEGNESVDLSDFSEAQIGYHKYLLVDAKFALGNISETDYPRSAIITGLTWEGHDFLDAARNDSIWKKVIKKVSNSTGTVALDVLKALLNKALIEYINSLS